MPFAQWPREFWCSTSKYSLKKKNILRHNVLMAEEQPRNAIPADGGSLRLCESQRNSIRAAV